MDITFRDHDKHKLQQTVQMEKDWDSRAVKNAVSFTTPDMKSCTFSEFFEYGRQQAYTLTHDSFATLAFEPAGKRMLEIGCGIGRLLTGFIEMFTEVWGVDISQEMLNKTSQMPFYQEIKLIQNNGYDLADIPDNHFDFVFSYNTLPHIPEGWMVSSYLSETHRVLRSGGIFQLQFRAKKSSFRKQVYLHLP